MLKAQRRWELVSVHTTARVTHAGISGICMESAGMGLECVNIQDRHHKKVSGDDSLGLRTSIKWAQQHRPGQRFTIQTPVNGFCFADYISIPEAGRPVTLGWGAISSTQRVGEGIELIWHKS